MILRTPSPGRACAAAVALCCCASALAQGASAPTHQSTTPAPNARFELLQSAIDAKWTFRLDRYTGRVWQMVKGEKEGAVLWEEIPVSEAPKMPANPAPNRPRFQIFSSGIAARHTFLLDGDTGKTWIAVIGQRKRPDGSAFEGPLWQPVTD